MPVGNAIRWLVLCFLSVLLTAQPMEAAPKRVALLFGNQDYKTVGVLANPGNDVKLMKSALEKAGFDAVTIVNDADVSTMRKALRSFQDVAGSSDVAVVYYSGHGMEMNGMNYLIPVDAVLDSDKDVEDETISLDRVQRSIEGASKLKLIILDACRNNPFLETMSRSISKRSLQRGLAKVEPESSNMLVAFASKAGTEALDGAGNNSPFATALAKFLIEPGLDIRIALGKVRDEVLKLTNSEQEPFVYGSLGGSEIVLNINVNVTVANNKSESKTPPENTLSAAAADWQNIRDLADADLLTAFLQKHGDDPVYRMLAEKKMKQLDVASKSGNVGNDQIAWDSLKGSTDAAALQRFVTRYPDSPLRKEAEQQIAALQPKPDQPNTATGLSAEAKECYTLAAEKQAVPGFSGIDFDKIDAKQAVAACKQANNTAPEDIMLVETYARALDADQNYSEARKYYNLAAAKGNLYAETNLGWFSILGNDEDVDILSGKIAIEKAAKAGNPFAQASLGLLYRGGYDKIAANDATAFKWYLLAAEQGYIEGLNYIGWAYGEGTGVKQDYQKSLEFYRKAADLGDPDSMSSIGFAYENGNGVLADLQEARIWYEKAAKAGDGFALGALGSIYEDGKGVSKDYAMAIDWYEKGADAGNPSSMSGLARLYDKGLGATKDPQEAARWAIAGLDSGDQDFLDLFKTQPDDYSLPMRKQMQTLLKERGFYKGTITGKIDTATKAALDALFGAQENGDAKDASLDKPADKPGSGTKATGAASQTTPEVEKCRNLASDPYIGPEYTGYDFSEMDSKTATETCTKAVAQSPDDAALLNLLGRAAEARKDFALARKSYTSASEKGDINAEINLALMEISGAGGKQDITSGLARLTKAADKKNPNAQYRLAVLYNNSHGVNADLPKAFNYLQLASDAGNIWAMADLAVAFDEGIGTVKSPELAAKWAIDAIQKGNNEILDVLKTSSGEYSVAARQNIQKKLVEFGYLKGPVTGKFDPATFTALDMLAQKG